eukprot:6459538-Amphidinium_carterae.2
MTAVCADEQGAATDPWLPKYLRVLLPSSNAKVLAYSLGVVVSLGTRPLEVCSDQLKCGAS